MEILRRSNGCDSGRDLVRGQSRGQPDHFLAATTRPGSAARPLPVRSIDANAAAQVAPTLALVEPPRGCPGRLPEPRLHGQCRLTGANSGFRVAGLLLALRSFGGLRRSDPKNLQCSGQEPTDARVDKPALLESIKPALLWPRSLLRRPRSVRCSEQRIRRRVDDGRVDDGRVDDGALMQWRRAHAMEANSADLEDLETVRVYSVVEIALTIRLT